MIELTIDNQKARVPQGATILDAATALGIAIPTLCSRDGCRAETSCMACVVKVRGREGMAPSCATAARDGMIVESETDEVRGIRRAALELLVSDHLGDCDAPCQVACPAGMNVPRMIRRIADGRDDEAIRIVRERVALPAVLSRICHRPCEKACRRAQIDGAVAICLLQRFVADRDLSSSQPYLPQRAEPSGKRVAVVGAGPAGLTAAYHLLRRGHACTIFDSRDSAGGTLRAGVARGDLPADVLDAEVESIRTFGAVFRLSERVGEAISVSQLQRESDAVLLAVGQVDAAAIKPLGVEMSAHGVAVRKGTFETSAAGVFAAGDVVRGTPQAIRSAGDGRACAVAVDQYLRGLPVTGEARRFSTHIGKLKPAEMEPFLSGASSASRVEVDVEQGLGDSQARAEAGRCLHCDCRKADDCRLREACQACGAKASRYHSSRRVFEADTRHDLVIYEPGKCIACGLCVQIAAQEGEELGLTFVGRGFDVRVEAAFGGSMAAGLARCAERCVEACPTGALAMK